MSRSRSTSESGVKLGTFLQSEAFLDGGEYDGHVGEDGGADDGDQGENDHVELGRRKPLQPSRTTSEKSARGFLVHRFLQTFLTSSRSHDQLNNQVGR